MLRLAAHFVAVAAGVPVVGLVARPILGEIMPCGGNNCDRFLFAYRAGVEHAALFRAGGRLDNDAIVPNVLRFVAHFAAVAAYVPVIDSVARPVRRKSMPCGGNGCRRCLFAYRTGVGLYALFRTSGLCRHDAAVPGMLRLAAHFAAAAAGVPVIGFVARPILGEIMPCGGNALLFGCMADGTLARTSAVVRAVGFFGDCPFSVRMPCGGNDRIRLADLGARFRIGKTFAAIRADPIFDIAVFGTRCVCRRNLRKVVFFANADHKHDENDCARKRYYREQ